MGLMDSEFESVLSLTGAESAMDAGNVEKAVEGHDDGSGAGGAVTEAACGVPQPVSSDDDDSPPRSPLRTVPADPRMS
ncbi:hypothetical protein Aduo_018361 [Ancylostoma duodenale]